MEDAKAADSEGWLFRKRNARNVRERGIKTIDTSESKANDVEDAENANSEEWLFQRRMLDTSANADSGAADADLEEWLFRKRKRQWNRLFHKTIWNH